MYVYLYDKMAETDVLNCLEIAKPPMQRISKLNTSYLLKKLLAFLNARYLNPTKNCFIYRIFEFFSCTKIERLSLNIIGLRYFKIVIILIE